MSDKSDTIKLMAYTATLGDLNTQNNRMKKKFGGDYYNKRNDIESGGKGDCGGKRTGTGKHEGHVMLAKDKQGWNCGSYKKSGFHKRKQYYAHVTRKPNSENWSPYENSGNIAIGQPCPYAEKTKYASSLNPSGSDVIKLSCDYPKIDDSLLRKMSSKMESWEKGGTRYQTWLAVAGKYCDNPGNAYKKIHKNETTCKKQFKNKNLAVKYCETKDNIAKDQKNCTVENLTPSVYDKVAKTFCKANPSNKWCGCYNIINRVCDSDPNAAGCLTWVQKKAILKSSGQDVSVYDSKPQCAAPGCTGSEVFTPATGDSMTCTQKYNICTQNIKQGVAKNSPTNAQCNLSHAEQKEADKNGASDPSKVGAMARKEESLTDQLKTLAQLDSMDKEDAAAGGGGAGKKKSGGSNTLILVIVAFVMLCMCGGLVLAMK